MNDTSAIVFHKNDFVFKPKIKKNYLHKNKNYENQQDKRC